MVSTFQSFREKGWAASFSDPQPQRLSCQNWTVLWRINRGSPSDLAEGKDLDSSEREGDNLTGRFKFAASETGELLKSIWDTLSIKEE